MSKFHFHFKASSIPLVFTELSLDSQGYGQFEYYDLQEGNLLIAYCSDRGVQEQYDYGREHLFDPKKRQKIFESIKEYDQRLMKFKPPVIKGLDSKQQNNIWLNASTELKQFLIDFGVYLIMEPMPLASLAEYVTKICKRDGLEQDKVLADISIAENFSEEEKTLVSALHILEEIKFSVYTHIEPIMRAVYEILKFIASQTGISFEEAIVMTNDEIESFLEKGIRPSTDLKTRSKGAVFFSGGNKKTLRMLDGEEYKKWKNILEPKFVREIKGKIAFRGKVQGPVVIHLSWIDTTPVPEGSILVTGMTNPQMVPFIKNAGAIVTDEGGLTCHAAIISREMKKPCIVGTKVATQVLKDGDLVEVDANKGIVTIIKKAE